ncbi:flagellar hook-associated protein FlgK [Thorsellia anophelis]|uniref:Flagellar hook-associated protein 1 n=1 Tax=Thorsellia anophelis DSM 18579 TaxID=1123402 RepID=A0A1H9ZEW7_9GAMM|nr:flagellar hook-associated protein FlgK [Thorsellia anophelis]SES80190.1 flagellar hook-associated protein 1 FlgK [Thorsellia anophelis DSM 18579]
MSGNLLNIGLSGINVSQLGLNTVSNNISNLNTPGYNRQIISIADQRPTGSTSGFIGNGAKVLSVDRLFDQFLNKQLRTAQSLNSTQSTVYNQLRQIDNLLANSSHNLSDGLQEFFNNVQNMVSNPSDSAARQTVIGSAESMVSQFGFVDNYLRELNDGVNESISDIAGQVNTYTAQIANLNIEITKARGLAAGQEPNQLLDQRDFLVSELNKLVGVQVTEQNGAYNVSFANGLSLVQGNQSNTVSAIRSSSDPTRMAISYSPGPGINIEIPESQIKSGELGGLYQFRDSLDKTRNEINQIAMVFADKYNEQHKLGFDLLGNAGKDMFSIGAPVGFSNTNNNGTAVIESIERIDTPKMQGTDYRLDYIGVGQWRVTRLSDNTVINPTVSGTVPVVIAFEGIEINIDDESKLVPGDNFKIKPTMDAITGFDLLIRDPAEIAAAGTAGSGPSDNENAKLLLDLQNQTLVNGLSTFNGAYAKVVGAVGSATNSAEVNFRAQENIVNQLTMQQQNLSGVNKDQEYIDLQKFVQHYQASAEVIKTASTIFNAILSIR